jgi:formylglycine-generating enzyme required for sulfatase activity
VIATGSNTLTVDRGTRHGLRVGLRGTIQAIDQDGTSEFEINMGTGTIRRASETTAEVTVESIGRGFVAGDARFILFTADPPPVETPRPEPRITPQPPSPPPVQAPKITQNNEGYSEAAFAQDTVMITSPGGAFTVGSPSGEGDPDEHPAHRVMLDDFWIGKTEVTFDQYDAFCRDTGRTMADDGGFGRGDQPVINVSWNDATAYCKWLSRKTGMLFRLPSESEWEKAAKGFFPWGSAKPDQRLANFGNLVGHPVAVGSYPGGASVYGVHDLAGNVWEWTADWYSPSAYRDAEEENPTGPDSGTERCVRGGSWRDGAGLIRSANRSPEKPASRLNVLGFRLAMSDS